MQPRKWCAPLRGASVRAQLERIHPRSLLIAAAYYSISHRKGKLMVGLLDTSLTQAPV